MLQGWTNALGIGAHRESQRKAVELREFPSGGFTHTSQDNADNDGGAGADELSAGQVHEVDVPLLPISTRFVSVLIPPELHQKLIAFARAEGCSIEKPAISILERSISDCSADDSP